MTKKVFTAALLFMALANSACVEQGNSDDRLDQQPDSFSFNDRVDAPVSTLFESNTITISGINTATSVSIAGGEYSVNDAAYTARPGDVQPGDQVTLRQASAADFVTTTDATLIIGGVSDTFSVTTMAAPAPLDNTADAFAFVDQQDIELATMVVSNPVLVSGINSAVPVSISNGLYSINGRAFTSVDGTVNAGDSVTIQLVSANDYATTVDATLTISSVSDTFSVTTVALPAMPADFALPPLAPGDPAFVSAHFSGSQNCSQCHDGIRDSSGSDVSIVTDWSSSMMANSTRDPFWRAKLSVELLRNPALAEVLNDTCTRCHAPMANEEMRRNGEFIEVLDNGLLDAGHARHDATMEGVSCTLCHQLEDTDELGTLAGFSGEFDINESKTAYGPYRNVFAQPMVNSSGYTPAFSQHIKDSELCASCHNLKTPFVDEFGNLLSQTPEQGFPEQMPYTEWLHSDYASQQSCQDCHMSRADGVVMSNRPPQLTTQRDNFAVHDFIGANKLMLDIFDNNRVQLGVRAADFSETMAKTDAMLASAANVQLVQSTLGSGVLDFTVQVNSQTGHKLPSSYPSRRLIVHVTVRDNAGNLVFESGRVNADGSVVGVDADNDAQTFEPHHDLITSESQVQVYEAIMGNNHDQVTYTLLRGSHYLKDNRLLPTGFDKSTAPDDVAVLGQAMLDDDFAAGSDQLQYRLGGMSATGYQVQVELVYQALAHAFAQDLFRANTAESNDFRLMFERSNHKSTVIATAQFSIN